jgi:hypothetical protein
MIQVTSAVLDRESTNGEHRETQKPTPHTGETEVPRPGRSAGAEGRAGVAHRARQSATDLSADGILLLIERPLLGSADVAMV